MAKTFTATWLGDGDPTAQMITEGGIRFIKGEAVKVPEDVSFNGIAWANAFKGNPTFATQDDPDEPVDAGEDAEREELTKQLDAAGIKYRANATLESLRGLLAAK